MPVSVVKKDQHSLHANANGQTVCLLHVEGWRHWVKAAWGGGMGWGHRVGTWGRAWGGGTGWGHRVGA